MESEENVELPQSYSSSLSLSEYSAPVEPSLLYTPWSTCGDDTKASAASQMNLKSRIQPERSDYGSERDLYGLVSDILGEQEKSQPYCAEGSCPSSLKSIWPTHTTRAPDHHDLMPETKRPVVGAASQQGFYSAESIPAEKHYLQSGNLTSQQKGDECYQGFAGVDLQEQCFYPSRSEHANRCQVQAQEDIKAAAIYQNYPYIKTTFPPQAGYSEAIRDSGAEPYPYGREKVSSRGGDEQWHQKQAETFLPQFHRYNESPDYSRYTDYSHASTAKPSKGTNCSLQENKLVSGATEAPSLFTEPYAKLFQVQTGTQKKPEDRISDQQNLTYSKAVELLSEKQSANEASFCTDFGQKFEYGLKPFTACPGNSDCAEGVEKQQFPKSSLQNSDYCKPLPLLPSTGSPSAAAGVRPAWMSVQSKTAAPVPLQNPNPLLKLNSHLPVFPKGSNQSNEFFQLPASNFPVSSNLFQKYCQDNPPFLASLDLGYNTAEGAHSAACIKALARGGEENPAEYLNEKKPKQPNRFCGDYSAQQFGIIENLTRHNFQVKPQGEHYDLGRQKRADVLLQNTYQDLMESQAQFAVRQRKRDNNIFSPSSFSNNCAVGDFRHNNQRASSALPLRSAQLFGHSVVPLVESHDLFSQDDFKHFYPCFKKELCGDSPFAGLVPALRLQRQVKARHGPASELHLRLEECYEQWRALEKERKKTESVLAKNVQGKKISSANNTPIPRLPPNPSRVDRLIVDQLREQARVVTLLGKMERLRSSPLQANIPTALDKHLEVIHSVQARRKDEVVNAANRRRQGAPRSQEDREVLALAVVIRELSVATRRTRTSLWCALQMTLPKPPAPQPDPERAQPEEKVEDNTSGCGFLSEKGK